MSACMRPEYAVQLKPDEEILDVVREHAATHAWAWLLAVAWLLLPFFLAWPLFRYGPVGVAVFGALLASGLLYAWLRWRHWRGTMLVVTNRRVIDVETSGLFGRRVTSVPFRRVDEVVVERRGAGAFFLRYATVRVVTAGSAADIEFVRAPGAERLRDLIESRRDAEEEEDEE